MRLLVRVALFSILVLAASAGIAGEVAFDPRFIGPESFASPNGVVTGYIIRQASGGVVCETLAPEVAEAIKLRSSKAAIPLRPIRNSQPRTNATGLQIVLLGTTQLDDFPDAKAAFIRAAEIWEAIILNPITVTLEADFGPTAFGTNFSSALTIGVTLSSQFGVTYTAFRNRITGRPSNGRETALFPLFATSGIPTDLGLATQVLSAGPVLESLGIGPSDGETFENPQIGFNSAFNFDTNRTDGVAPDKVDFETVAIHEIGHALGFASFVGRRELDGSFPVLGSVLDLFRFRAGTTTGTFGTAQRILSSGGEHRFFAGAPELALSTGRTDGTGGDSQQAGHWKASSITGSRLGIMDPQVAQGAVHDIVANDLLAFDTIGYVVAINGSPTAPSGLDLVALNETEVTLSWTDNAAIESGFHLYGAQDERPFNRLGTAAANATTIRLTGLLPGEIFRFTVSAFNATGESAFAEIATITMPGTPASGPAAPTSLTARLTSPTEVELRWVDNSTDESGFNVYVAEGNGEFSLLGSTAANATGGTVSGLAPGGHLRFKITAFNAAGESAPSNTAEVGSPPASRRRPARR